MKILISVLCVLSLILAGLTIKREFIDHPKDTIVQTKLAYHIGCMEGSYALLNRLTEADPRFLMFFCSNVAQYRDTDDLLDFIEKIKYNTNYEEEILNGNK